MLESKRTQKKVFGIFFLKKCVGKVHAATAFIDFLIIKMFSLLFQKNFRAWNGARKYRQMRTGYMRLQALIRSRVLSHKFRHLRGHVVGLQVRGGKKI